MTSDPRQKWEQELIDRQSHNYVFPGTMINSTEALRKLVNRPLRGKLQKFGFLLWLCPGYLCLVFIIAIVYGATHDPLFSWREAVFNVAIGTGVFLAILFSVGTVIGVAHLIQRVIDFREQSAVQRVRNRWRMPVGRRRPRG